MLEKNKIIPIIPIRNPINRIISSYFFEKGLKFQLSSREIAQKLTLNEWISYKIDSFKPTYTVYTPYGLDNFYIIEEMESELERLNSRFTLSLKLNFINKSVWEDSQLSPENRRKLEELLLEDINLYNLCSTMSK